VTGHEVRAAACAGGVLLFLVVRYMASCLYRPKTWCWVCRRHPSRDPAGRNWRDCWWCKGTGFRLRYGKRIYDRWSGKKVKR